MPGTCYPKSRRRRPSTASQWSITFASLLAALVAFLVLLLALSQTDKANQLFNAFSFGKTTGTFEFQRAVQLVRMKEKLRNALALMIKDGTAELSEAEEGFLIQIDADVLFPPDTLALRPELKPKLYKIAQLLAKVPNLVYVIGHMDNPPSKTSSQQNNWRDNWQDVGQDVEQNTGQGVGQGKGQDKGQDNWKNNWSLSAVYAATVVHFLTTKGKVDAKRLQVRGMGQHSPRVDYNSEEMRRRNRRIEIIVSHKIFLPETKSLEEQATNLLSSESDGIHSRKPKSLHVSDQLWHP